MRPADRDPSQAARINNVKYFRLWQTWERFNIILHTNLSREKWTLNKVEWGFTELNGKWQKKSLQVVNFAQLLSRIFIFATAALRCAGAARRGGFRWVAAPPRLTGDRAGDTANCSTNSLLPALCTAGQHPRLKLIMEIQVLIPFSPEGEQWELYRAACLISAAMERSAAPQMRLSLNPWNVDQTWSNCWPFFRLSAAVEISPFMILAAGRGIWWLARNQQFSISAGGTLNPADKKWSSLSFEVGWNYDNLSFILRCTRNPGINISNICSYKKGTKKLDSQIFSSPSISRNGMQDRFIGAIVTLVTAASFLPELKSWTINVWNALQIIHCLWSIGIKFQTWPEAIQAIRDRFFQFTISWRCRAVLLVLAVNVPNTHHRSSLL